METALTVALVSAAVALLSMIGNGWISRRNSKAIEKLRSENEQSKDARERLREISKYSEPLARAAYDLQSRIYNIVKQGLIKAYLVDGDERERKYVTENTCFVIAQYFCWTELIRRDIQFTDLDSNDVTLQLLRFQDEVSWLWGTDHYDPPFRIFAGEQRAVGEALLQTAPRGSECMGFGTFMIEARPGVNELLDAIRLDTESFAYDSSAEPRLRAIQNALIDLLDHLDPNHIRFASNRAKLALDM